MEISKSILKSFIVLIAAGILLFSGVVDAADWPCYRGTNKDGITNDTIDRWPPVELWRASLGEGYSQVTVSNGKVYTAGWAPSQDTVYCFDEASIGVNPAPLWTQSYSRASTGYGSYEGTRATPTVDTSGSYVYMFSHGGQLSAFNKVTGTPAPWSPVTTTWGRNSNWGFASSPLIEGSLVIVNASGGGVAFDKTTGVRQWPGASTGQAGYASPFAFTRGVQRTIVVFAAAEVVGIDPADGSELWNFPWNTDADCNAADPIVSVPDDQIFISSAYNKSGCALINLGSGLLTAVYGDPTPNSNLANWTNCSVKIGDYIYGIDENSDRLKCIRFSDGVEMWESPGTFGSDHGSVLGVAGGTQILVLSTSGDLKLVEASSASYNELETLSNIISGATWTCPVLANGKLYLRSQQGTLVCFDVTSGGAPLTASIDTPASDPYIVSTGNNTDVFFEGSAADGAVPYVCDWDLDDNGLYEIQDNPSPTGTFNVGATQVELRVTDDNSDTAADTITVIVWDDNGTSGVYGDDSNWDSDGLPDGWEWDYFGDFDEIGSDNPDGDSYTNAEEYTNGTDPTTYTAKPGEGGTKGGCLVGTSSAGLGLMLFAAVVGLCILRKED